MNRIRTVAAIGTLALLATACGSDEESSDTTATLVTSAPATTAAGGASTVSADTTADTAGTEPSSEFAEICALAQVMNDQEMPPTAAQMTQYQELAPQDLRPDIDPLVEAFVPVEGDLVGFFNVAADDQIEVHLDALAVFEEENCAIPADNDPAEGSTWELEDGAQRVDVIGQDFAFEFESPTEAGRTSFVFTNEGVEAHFLLVVKLAEGVTLQEALESEDPEGLLEGEWETKLAAGGGDEEVVTFDLEPGSYGLLCFIPTVDGTPHAFLGMTSEFTIEA